jgi:hypothetical protein
MRHQTNDTIARAQSTDIARTIEDNEQYDRELGEQLAREDGGRPDCDEQNELSDVDEI